MDNKYFTPDIEDIRVGYECETHQTKYDRDNPENSYDRWIPISLSDENVRYLFNYNASKIGGLGLRTSYLTKEQIEAEGWEWVDYSKANVDYKEAYFKHTSNPKKALLELRLNYLDEPNMLWIYNRAGLSTLYWGECKDVNTLRYICKLLKI